ncbi:hypothetical protein DPMN_041693 [Dreissena polymorpha]|uniref:Uncharacterized protein n=2 Tax=Dreissena polymorpha TaxID=45954 RepID=A0A9D4CZI6_DREPO|nr:hypothetical protein DPMN_041693 [Dreissena polymorpha]
MDEIIKRENGTLNRFSNGSRPGSLYSVRKPVYAVGPNRNSAPQSVKENPIYSQPMRSVPYIIPESTDLQDDGGNAPGKHVSYIRLRDSRKTPMTNGGPGGNDGPVSNSAFALTQSIKDLSDVYDPSNSSPESTSLDHEKSKPESVLNKNKMLEDGAVTIHVNNISNPSVPSSTRSGPSSVNSGS